MIKLLDEEEQRALDVYLDEQKQRFRRSTEPNRVVGVPAPEGPSKESDANIENNIQENNKEGANEANEAEMPAEVEPVDVEPIDCTLCERTVAREHGFVSIFH